MTDKKLLPIIIIVTLALGFGGGMLYSNIHASNSVPVVQKLVNQDTGQVQNVDFSEFWKVWNILADKYVDQSKLDVQKMVYGAISGMVNAIGDPYTVFFEPATSKQFQEQIAGAFGGVGLEIDSKNSIVTVIAPVKDTPASRAGVLPGDRIVKIDGKVTSGMSVDQAVSLIRGKVGTKVTLTIAPAGNNTTHDVTLTRETIKVPSIEWKIVDANGKHTAYIQIYEFTQNLDADFKKAAGEILKSNADNIVIDLRSNPGGLLDTAIDLAGYFVDKGQIVVSEGFGNGTRSDFKADGNASLGKYPTVILVNGGSASASEILAGALHDDKHIKLVGEKTFGKGVVQELEDLDAGASLKVTIARWYTPAGVNISLKGIDPDVAVTLTDDDKKNFAVGDPAKDPQLKKALDVLK